MNKNTLPNINITEVENVTPGSQWYEQSKGDLSFAVKSIVANELSKDEPNVRVARFVDKNNLPHVSYTVDLPSTDGTPMSVMLQTYDKNVGNPDNIVAINSFKKDVADGKNIIPTEMRIYTDEKITEGDDIGKHSYETQVLYWNNPHAGVNTLQEELGMSDDSGKRVAEMRLIEKESREQQDPKSEIMFNQSLRQYLTTTFGFQE